uniref:Sodium:proton antiporter n=1 Tax=Staphylothermus marinus TaxID=2280 RepID=A0A7C4HG32_STAMA
MNRDVIGLIVLLALIIGFSLLLSIAGKYYIPNPESRKPTEIFGGNNQLAYLYLKYTYYPNDTSRTVLSPEAVTAIVWDFRGLDTLFETTVFYLAIIGALALGRGLIKIEKPVGEHGLSIIVKTVTRLTSVLIVTVAASIALHGHLTPGGGFQGGSAAAVAPLLILIIFSIYYFLEKGISKTLMLIIRSIGLIVIGLVAISCFIIGVIQGSEAFVFQNQRKIVGVYGEHSIEVSLPSHIAGELISGTLWFFNIAEFFAVMAGFTIVFMLLFVPEKAFREGGGK